MKSNPLIFKLSNLFLVVSVIFISIVISLIVEDIFQNNRIKSINFETGVYKSYHSDFTIELNNNGNVFITPKKNNVFYCTRKGNWTLNDSIITIKITDKNEDIYCDWVENLDGDWKINGNTISKDNYKLVKK